MLLDNRAPALITIGADVWLTTGCVILTHGMCSALQRERFGMTESNAPVTLERGVFLGCGTIILPGVTIGEGSYIGAGSVVSTDIPPGVVAAGNPARVIRPLDKQEH
ncbi:putative Protein CapG [Magnetofaba australis IT-1]|uniref:Uncharacterized protein n=1 Tax=Magnetofaba australis IT-1 TaxID=1434232 RepID=A0A1Y2K4X1_9PROT|nr:putative Protein CapG [Magnetofaba australis IT-1]